MSLTILALLPEAAAVTVEFPLEVGAELGALLDRTELEAVDPVRAKHNPHFNFDSKVFIIFCSYSRAGSGRMRERP